MRPTAIITICKYLIGSWWCVNRSTVYCTLLAPQWKANLRSTSVQVMNTWPLGYSITRLESRNRKFAAIWIITGPKNDHFFVCKKLGLLIRGSEILQKWLWLESRVIDCDSSRVILWKRDSIRVTIFLNLTRVESELPKIMTRVESMTRVTLSLVSAGLGRTVTRKSSIGDQGNVCCTR